MKVKRILLILAVFVVAWVLLAFSLALVIVIAAVVAVASVVKKIFPQAEERAGPPPPNVMDVEYEILDPPEYEQKRID